MSRWRLELPGYDRPPLSLNSIAQLCDNGRSGSEGATNTARSLTHLLEQGERGLGMKPTRCIENGCERASVAFGRCDLHYRRARRAGVVTGRPTLHDRMFSYVEKVPGGCWLWRGTIEASGYGRVGIGRTKNFMAHRVMYEMLVGPIPDGLQLDHLCRVRACVNPNHLEAVTPRVNSLRSENLCAQRARKTHCPKGHPYSGENLVITRQGHRICRECRRRSALAGYHRRKAAR